jgi:serine/threonine-protein kinase PknK
MSENIPGYQNLSRIGHGGFSVVYRAHQEAFDRTVALKVLRASSDDETHHRFLREVKLTGRLTGHPHVVTILDAGVTEAGRPYLATEFYEGGSLKDRLRTEGPLPAARVAAIGAKIADALAAAHEVGIVHRDVKPGNILLSRFGVPALADFGVGHLIDAAASDSVLDSFSLHHAAPEVISRSSPSPVSDVYSLGSTLFELLTGHPPFGGEAEEVPAILWQIVHEPPPAVHCPDLPGLGDQISLALSKDPDDRPQSAAEFARALNALIVPAAAVEAVGALSAAGSVIGPLAMSGSGAAAELEIEPAADPEAGPQSGALLLPAEGAGAGIVPAESVKAYVSAFEPGGAAPAGRQEPGPAPVIARRRSRWPVFAGASFGVALVVSLVAALLLSSHAHDAAAGPSDQGTGSNAVSGGPANLPGSGGGIGGTGPAAGIRTGGASGAALGASGSTGSAGPGAGATGAAKSPTSGSGDVTNSPAGVTSSSAAATTAAADPVKCDGWTFENDSDATGTLKGAGKLHAGPYTTCTLQKAGNKTAVTVYCSVINKKSEEWLYVQVSGDTTGGWIMYADLHTITGTVNAC